MVIAMKNINDFLPTLAFGFHMKNKSVGDIFKECPEEHPTEKNKQDSTGAVIIFCSRCINDKGQDRDVHTPDNQRIRLCQGFQEIVFEQAYLSFIVNFFEMHMRQR